jgi:2-keto-3-deoxy-L-rhamnonate aldolase RhmA
MILSLITNNLNLIAMSKQNGIDRIMIDLEFLGKKERQSGFDLFQSEHNISDIKTIKKEYPHIELFVRINQINENTKKEIDEILTYGVDYIMLPFFKTIEEVKYFLEIINNRCKTSLLLETKESLEILDEILKIDSIDEYHIGLNDLSLSFGNKNIFETLKNKTIEQAICKLKFTQKNYGFGGVGSVNKKDLLINPVLFLYEQLRTGCNIAWLGRSFRNDINDSKTLKKEVGDLKNKISEYQNFSPEKKNELMFMFYKQLELNEEKLNNSQKNYRI